MGDKLKYLSLFLFLGILLSCEQSKEKWLLWEEENVQTMEDIVLSNWELFDFFPLEKAQDLEPFLDGFHVVDLDADKDLDIAYTGEFGGEGKLIAFFFNVNGKYKKGPSLFGTIESAEYSDQPSFHGEIKYVHCCAGFEVDDDLVEFRVQQDSLVTSVLERTKSHQQTPEPMQYLESPYTIKVLEDPSFLRVTPTRDTSTYYFPSEEPTNIYIDYQPGDLGDALAEYVDSLGNEWLYIRMNPIQNTSQFDVDASESIVPSYKGWMSKDLVSPLNP